MITSSRLSTLKNIRHGFMTREGGVSEGLYRGLNCGFGSRDAGHIVAQNRHRAAARLGLLPEQLVSTRQIHGTRVAVITSPREPEKAPEADGMVTTTQGIALGIVTADCAPVLLADGRAGVIGAAHAGWKGAVNGVLEATVDAMKTLGASPAHIHAAIGPAISRAHYEVGPEFRDIFVQKRTRNDQWFTPSGKREHFLFNLPGYIVDRLESLGISGIDDTGLCTYAEQDRFFSCRRATHDRETDYGRQISIIVLEPALTKRYKHP